VLDGVEGGRRGHGGPSMVFGCGLLREPVGTKANEVRRPRKDQCPSNRTAFCPAGGDHPKYWRQRLHPIGPAAVGNVPVRRMPRRLLWLTVFTRSLSWWVRARTLGRR